MGDLWTLPTVQPWLNQFFTLQLFPHNVVAWIRISGLFRALYKKCILKVIGDMIGNVVKIDT